VATVLSYDIQKTARLIPGYDPFATAGDAWFDEDRAQLAIEFFPECLKHIEGIQAGQPFVLEPWQQAIAANLFGWYRKVKGRAVRRYRECLIFVPRKNGKTPLAAGVGIYHLFCDPERGQQNYIAASTREQAGLLFRHCSGMIEQEPELRERCRIYGGNAPGGQSQSIVIQGKRSFLKVISGDVKAGKHGKNSNLAVVDELHEQPDRDLTDTLRTSMASANKPQPLLIYLTTSDFEREGSICNEIHDRACKIRDGILDVPSFLPVIYEASKEDDWTDPGVWARCNPNLAVSVSEDYLRDECKHAQDSPTYENTFKRLHLNIRTEQDVRWLAMDQWEACGGPVGLATLRDMPCWMGLDMSTTTDVTALVQCFRDDDGHYWLVPHFWIPDDKARERENRDRVPYLAWANQGLVKRTNGNAVDYETVRHDIVELAKQCNLQELAADPWNATHITQELEKTDGLPVVEHRQGYASMSGPMKEFEAAVLAGRVHHDGNPVLRWMISNVTADMDPAGNVKPNKAKSGGAGRIDGAVAAIMAVGRAACGDGGSFNDDSVVIA